MPYFYILLGLMSDVEFFSKLNPKRLNSLGEDFKTWRREFQEDEKRNALKRVGNLETQPAETTYERFPEET
jgi:hypothetical protein